MDLSISIKSIILSKIFRKKLQSLKMKKKTMWFLDGVCFYLNNEFDMLIKKINNLPKIELNSLFIFFIYWMFSLHMKTPFLGDSTFQIKVSQLLAKTIVMQIFLKYY